MNITSTAVGAQVLFRDWNDEGEYVTMQGTVEAEFREPESEDRYQRLSYRVRLANGQVWTPYAHECQQVAA